MDFRSVIATTISRLEPRNEHDSVVVSAVSDDAKTYAVRAREFFAARCANGLRRFKSKIMKLKTVWKNVACIEFRFRNAHATIGICGTRPHKIEYQPIELQSIYRFTSLLPRYLERSYSVANQEARLTFDRVSRRSSRAYEIARQTSCRVLHADDPVLRCETFGATTWFVPVPVPVPGFAGKKRSIPSFFAPRSLSKRSRSPLSRSEFESSARANRVFLDQLVSLLFLARSRCAFRNLV